MDQLSENIDFKSTISSLDTINLFSNIKTLFSPD